MNASAYLECLAAVTPCLDLVPDITDQNPGCFGAKLRLKSDFSPGSLHGCRGPVSATIRNTGPINIKYRPPGTHWSYWYWYCDPSRALTGTFTVVSKDPQSILSVIIFAENHLNFTSFYLCLKERALIVAFNGHCETSRSPVDRSRCQTAVLHHRSHVTAARFH